MTAGLGCATKGDVRDLRGELDVLANRQGRALLQLEFLTEANRDSLASQSDALFQLRGDVLQELLAIQTQLVTLQELTGQSQRALTELRDRIETQRTMLQTPVTSADSSTTGPGRSGHGRSRERVRRDSPTVQPRLQQHGAPWVRTVSAGIPEP